MKSEVLVVPQDVCCVIHSTAHSLRFAAFGKGAMLAPVASPLLSRWQHHATRLIAQHLARFIHGAPINYSNIRNESIDL